MGEPKKLVSYFQSQMSLVYNYNDDISVAASIRGLQATHLFYKHLVKNDVTKIRDILVRALKYMQIEEAIWATTSHRPKLRSEIEKLKPRFLLRKNQSHNSATVYKPLRRALESSKESAVEPDLIPFRIPIDHVLNTIKD